MATALIVTSSQLIGRPPARSWNASRSGSYCKRRMGEADHKILAALPGQDVTLGQELLQELQDFIATLFATFPDARVRVGPILPREAALQHLQNSRPTQAPG